MISQTRKRIGDVLIDANIITQEQLMTALEEQRKTGKRLGEVLVELKYTDETEIAEAMSHQMKIPLARIREAKLAPEIIELLPENIVRKNNVIPFELDENNPNILRIAMADPLDIIAVDDISIITNMQIDIMVATPSDITYAIEKYYGNEQSAKLAESFAQERMDKNQKLKKEEDGNDEVDNSPIVLLVNKIIEQAVNERASDIHIEALEDQVRVRYRIDGAMQEVMRYPKDLQSAIVARIKIVSGMNISEKRAPQDGRMTLIFNRVEYDLRVSSLPTTFGEKVVMRIASKSGLNKEKSELGFQEEELKRFDGILKNPHGIILVTGPTGSGKSTTLYTVLNELNGGDVNIITVEDPVEADVDGINQVQVNEKAGLTFASALRSILRQDPDIIMIGEIRDEETASIAVKAAITGHLVVSTLHTNSAASTVTRLEDMGIEPYMVADSVVGIIAQRLVRRICPKCHVQKQMTDTDKFRLRLRGDSNPLIYEPSESGCAYCNNTGYRGRIGVYEIMPISPALREVISRGGGAEEIQKTALKEGLTTLRLGAAKLVLKGVTSISEVERIAAE
mgnify:CR=1 FL=1